MDVLALTLNCTAISKEIDPSIGIVANNTSYSELDWRMSNGKVFDMIISTMMKLRHANQTRRRIDSVGLSKAQIAAAVLKRFIAANK
jgi:hypothetical protein